MKPIRSCKKCPLEGGARYRGCPLKRGFTVYCVRACGFASNQIAGIFLVVFWYIIICDIMLNNSIVAEECMQLLQTR